MPIRFHAEHIDHGVLLSKIETLEEAESVRNFFLEKSTPSAISQLSTPGDYKVYLPGPTKDQFAKLIEGANVELIP